MPGSSTAPGRLGTRNYAPSRVAFHHQDGVSTREKNDFAAQWLAYAYPCQRFEANLAARYA